MNIQEENDKYARVISEIIETAVDDINCDPSGWSEVNGSAKAIKDKALKNKRDAKNFLGEEKPHRDMVYWCNLLGVSAPFIRRAIFEMNKKASKVV